MSRHFARRADLATGLVLTLPLWLAYQVGVLLVPAVSGADLVTGALLALVGYDRRYYLGALAALSLALIVGLLYARGRRGWPRDLFWPTVLESGLYAVTMGSLILLVMVRLLGVDPRLTVAAVPLSAGAIVVLSCGAGFHEELVFRQLTLAGLARAGAARLGPRAALVLALAASSLLFALAHHVGPAGEPLRLGAVVYRTLAGALFGALFWWRGFAVAAWTHALYDVYVLSLRG